MSEHVLLTGGAGFIGTHTLLELLQSGVRVSVLDNLSQSSRLAVTRVEALAKRTVPLHVVDVRDAPALDRLFATEAFTAVVHFAGLKAVAESVAEPLRYWDNNVHGSAVLLDAMKKHGVRRLVFSSSATVYGAAAKNPIAEGAPLGAENPYGRTKLAVEDMLRDVAASEPGWRVLLLRYFNPVGAHASGELGEAPTGTPNNLMPFAMQVAVGRRKELVVYGNDYPTPDGTGVRDYIHVTDLALGHLAALNKLASMPDGAVAVNLGTGKGVSVLEVVRAVSAVIGRELPHRVGPRRPGDVAACFADPSFARAFLGWQAERDLSRMCQDAWRWQTKNPDGYATHE